MNHELRYSSESAPAATTLEGWTRVVRRNFGPTRIDSSTDRFTGLLECTSIDDLEVMRIRAQPSIVRKAGLPATSKHDASILVHLQLSGISVTSQGASLNRLRPGEATLCDPSQAYSIEFESDYEMFVLRLPIARLATRCPYIHARRNCARRLDVSLSQLLLAFLSTAWTQRGDRGGDPEWRNCVNATSLDLVSRAVNRSERTGVRGPGRELETKVLDHIRMHLFDPALRTSAIARAIKVSSRTVQTVFERMATTAGAFILSERLEVAAERLKESHHSITQIALDTGFADAAYFARCFRRRFGMSPREYSRH